MSFLSQVQQGKEKKILFSLIYGVPGIGKSTLASEAPDAFFIGDKKEREGLDVKHSADLTTLDEIRSALKEMVAAKELPFKTLVLDNLAWLEPIVWDEVVRDENKTSNKGYKNIDDIGWQKGHEVAVPKHLEIIELLKQIQTKHKIEIIVLGHSKVKAFNDPLVSSAYDQYQIAIHEKTANAWIRNVDSVLFMNYEVVKADEKDRYAQGEGVRIMYTQERPAFKAKNRYGLPFKLVMPKGEAYKTLKAAMDKGEPESPRTLLEEINGLRQSITDPQLLESMDKRIKEANGDSQKLSAIKQRALFYIGGGKA